MFDPRVRRGTTVARPSGKESEAGDGTALRSTAKTLRRRRRQVEQDVFMVKPKAAVGGDTLDLSSFLTEQDGPTASAPSVADAVCQTDAFVEQKEAEQYVPPKRGVDAGAQVEVSDLFDFVRESAPLVDVLAAKTLEQALVELEEEEELAALFAARHELQEAERARARRIAGVDSAAAALAGRRAEALQAARRRRQRELECRTKVLCAAVSRVAARAAVATAVASMHSRLLFADPVMAEAGSRVVEPAIAAALERVRATRVARQLADDLLASGLARQRDLHAAEKARLESEEARRRPYRVRVVLRGVMPPREEDARAADGEDEEADEAADGEDGEDGAGGAPALPPPGTEVEVMLGPILVARADTAAEVELRITAWIAANRSPVVQALMRGRRLRLAHKDRRLEPHVTLDSLSPEDLGQLHLINEPLPT